MALSEDVKMLLEALVIDGDPEKARHAAYRVAAHEAAKAGGAGKAFCNEVIRAYRVGNGTAADETIPEEVSQLVFMEHPEETFDLSRYFITDQARRIAEQVHAMRVSAPRLRALGLSARNTTLFWGPPGTGKTEMARWIAYREGLPLMYVNMSNTVDSLMGRTAKNISTVFRHAHRGACVLMVDELDCVANIRASGVRAADGELNRTTVTFMQEIDRLPPGVVMLAATNRYDMLDPALLRRFALVEQVERLPLEALRRMLNDWVRSTEEQSSNGVAFSEAEKDALMEGYEADESVTQAIVVQRATSLLAAKLLEFPELQIINARRPLRAFRVIDPENGMDVTRDVGRMREYAEREDWAQPVRYSGDPDGFLLDDSGHLRLVARNTFAVVPANRFEIVLSRYSEE
ncbi:MAG: AAA family ATPase [Eggerthellaceae bacterium]|nr:AAA family ATPase [Eggerthellaceae bacterium]